MLYCSVFKSLHLYEIFVASVTLSSARSHMAQTGVVCEALLQSMPSHHSVIDYSINDAHFLIEYLLIYIMLERKN